MALRADSSIVHFTDHSHALDLIAQSNPASTDHLISTSSSPASLSNRITFKGTYHDKDFRGDTLTGQRLTFQKTGQVFPIQGIAYSGKAALNVSGDIGDIFKNQIIDADINFSTPSASAINPFMNTHFPDTHPINVHTHLVKKSDTYDANNLQGRLGSTDVAGKLTYIHDKNRPSLKGSLSSNETQLNDLLSMMPGKESAKPAIGGSGSIVSRHTISTEAFKSQDLDLSLSVHKFLSPNLPLIEDLRMKVALTNGDLKINPMNAMLFGTSINATLSLNAQAQPISAQVVIDTQNFAINKALANTKLHDMVSAPLTAHIHMNSISDSTGKLLDNASGKMDFKVGRGEISNKLDAKMGLDFGKLVWLSIRGDKEIPLDRAAIHLDFKNGIGLSHDTEFETSQTITQGIGSINLQNDSLDFLLTPRPKDPTIFSLKSNIRIYGPLNKPQFKIERRSSTEKHLHENT
jgi:AsmA protein